MRLICPNCGAQYEVPDDVIPDGGRDVQCSNCGVTWFQRPAGQDIAAAEDLGEIPVTQSWSDLEAELDTVAAPDAVAGPDSAARPDPAQEPSVYPETSPSVGAVQAIAATAATTAAASALGDGYDEDETPPPRASALRRQLDPAVADMLREEAAREARVRASEAARSMPLETQTELGLVPPVEDETAKRARETRSHLARLRGTETAPPAADAGPQPRPTPRNGPRSARPPDPSMAAPRERAAPSQAATATTAATPSLRRELLPDVEEINSTLRAGSDRRPAEAADYDTPGTPPPRETTTGTTQPPGFLRGFAIPVIVVALLIILYLQGPRLMTTVPGLAGPLGSYIETVDGLRGWLDQQAQSLLIRLDAMARQSDDAGN